MKKYLFFLFSILTIFSCSKTTEVESFVVYENGISLRSKPTINSQVLTKIPFGTKLTLINDKEGSSEINIKTDWYKANYSGHTGWVLDGFKILEGKCPCYFTENFIGSLYGESCTLPFDYERHTPSWTGYEIAPALFELKNEFMIPLVRRIDGVESSPCYFIFDTLRIPKKKIPEEFQLLEIECFSNKSEYPFLQGIVKLNAEDGQDHQVLRSWRSNISSRKFEEIKDIKKEGCSPLCIAGDCY